MPYLKRDVYSTMNPSKRYAAAGQEIDIISDRGNVLLVRMKGAKDGFPCLTFDVTDNPGAIEGRGSNEPEKQAAVKKGRWQKGKAATEINQQSLF